MTRSMLAQSSGTYSGNHGLFQKYHIEALTLSSLDGAPKNARYGVLEMGRILEAIFRSLNNLLERFHQVHERERGRSDKCRPDVMFSPSHYGRKWEKTQTK